MARTQGSHSAATGPRVRAAAQTLFARHGFAAVSMRQIAREVGVQAGALYNYTPDKQALLFDLMRTHLEQLLAAWEGTGSGGDTEFDAAYDAGSDAQAQLEAFTRFHLRFHLDRPDAVFIAYMELRNLSAQNFEQIEALRQRYESTLADILERGAASGAFVVADVRVATRAIIAMLTGVTTWYRDQGTLSRAQIEQMYWDMVRNSVAVRGAAQPDAG